MTIIVACKTKDGTVLMAGDHAGTGGRYDQSIVQDAKVFKAGPLVVGYTGSFRFGQVIQEAITAASSEEWAHMKPEKLVRSKVLEIIRDALKTAGCMTIKDSVETGEFALIACGSELFTLQTDFSLLRSMSAYSAVGCADLTALGAMGALVCRVTAREAIEETLKICAMQSAGVREPFTILETDRSPAQ